MTQLSFVLPLLLVPALPSAAAPQGKFQDDARTRPVAHVEAAPYRDPRADNLQRALDAITNDRVENDIYFIASDEMAGRDTPSTGQRIAARFIRNRLHRLGWLPGAKDGYFHEYSLTRYGMDESRVMAEWHDPEGEVHALAMGEDYFLSPMARSTRDVTGPIVYVGGFDEEQIAALDLKGDWCLTEPGARLSRRRLESAQELGVAGFLVPPDPASEDSVADQQSRSMRWLTRSSFSPPRSFGAPVVYLTESLATNMGVAGDHALGATIDGRFRESFAYGVLEDLLLENVCGFWPGSDPELRKEVILVSAHYDHVGTSGDDVYNGADDNGSGTTGLLQIAEALAHYGPMRRSVMLLWVSGEEKGLLGSAAWTKDPWYPEEDMHAICNLNIDMIGRNASNEIGITPTQARDEYNRLTQIVEQQMKHEGFTDLNSADAYWSRSDHANFSRNMKIPVAFLFSDVHEDYHKPTDTPDKIDYDKIRRVSRLVVRMLHELQVDDLNLEID